LQLKAELAALRKPSRGDGAAAQPCALRLVSSVLGCRGTGSAGKPDARRIVAALGRGSLLWGSDICGGIRHEIATGGHMPARANRAPNAYPHRSNPSFTLQSVHRSYAA
jgi:hypothetical protein